ncbi:hypothetical protein Q3G72_016435 [Acer saccharum]|nr:hypothetical protein Q3G72_016435 [Acer saccharum]
MHAQQVLCDWGLGHAPLTPIAMGHINETYAVDAGAQRYILQRLNPIFKPEVHHDIDAITQQLAARGMRTPRLIPTQAQTLWTTDVDEGVWRLQTFMPGQVFVQASGAPMCQAAGLHLGRFHRALADLQHSFVAPRLGVHDTAQHVLGLQEALLAHRGHVAYGQVAPLADALLNAAALLPSMHQLPARIVHGDPKISNFVFAADGSASCLIDLDTLGAMAVPLELGDALRSWCNPNGEGAGRSTFEITWFEASLRGYASGAQKLLTAQEVALLPAALACISVELAVRFLRDALEERYFGWDKGRFAAAWEHNLVRAKSQWALATDYQAQQSRAVDIVHEVFGVPV